MTAITPTTDEVDEAVAEITRHHEGALDRLRSVFSDNLAAATELLEQIDPKDEADDDGR